MLLPDATKQRSREEAPAQLDGRAYARDLLKSRLVTRDESKNKQALACAESSPTFEADQYVFSAGRGRASVVAHAQPLRTALDGVAFVDALSFTVDISDRSIEWLIRALRDVFAIKTFEQLSGGYNGFTHKISIGNCKSLLAWGGTSQRGKAHVSFMGAECSHFQDWTAIADWLESVGASLTRVDLAHDDHDGERWSVERIAELYDAGGFNTGGRNPQHRLEGPWLDPSQGGRTFYVGHRENGKLLRAYEKGKKEGYGSDKWTRIEVEYRKKGRVLSYDMLRNPGQYLAGAYPCLHELSNVQSRVKTIQRAACASLSKAIDVARTQYGKLYNFVLQICDGDYAEAHKRLARPGVPEKFASYVAHLREQPELADLLGGLDAALDS
jgi:phage replication initiation protein